MDLGHLKDMLPALPPGELDEFYAAFRARQGGDDVERFAAYLHRAGRIIEDERHALPALLEQFLKVCDAVHDAHRRGVIHRDRDHLIHLPAVPGIAATYLVDHGARIVAGSVNGKGETYGMGTLINTVADLPVYPHQGVVAGIQAGTSGYLPGTGQGAGRLIAYHPIASIGWYLVVEADVAAVASEGGHRPVLEATSAEP